MYYSKFKINLTKFSIWTKFEAIDLAPSSPIEIVLPKIASPLTYLINHINQIWIRLILIILE
jgi:hypothetical protein